MIPESGKWQTQVRKEARKKLRTLVEEELKGKLITPLPLAKDDLIEVRMTFNKTGYNNLLNGDLPLINVDPTTGNDLSETSFTKRIINRIRKNDGGLQEFRVKVNRKKRYDADSEQSGSNNAKNDDSIEQSFEMLGNFDIISRVVPEEERSEEQSGTMSENWEKCKESTQR